MKFLFLAFVIIPITEITLLFKVGSIIGVFYTLLIILTTASLGAAILRKQGLAMLLQTNKTLRQGQIPVMEMAEGFLIAVSGALLLTPGFITDLMGFLLLVPAVRKRVIKQVIKEWEPLNDTSFSHFQSQGTYQGYKDENDIDEDVIEGEFVVKAEPAESKVIPVEKK